MIEWGSKLASAMACCPVSVLLKAEEYFQVSGSFSWTDARSDQRQTVQKTSQRRGVLWFPRPVWDWVTASGWGWALL